MYTINNPCYFTDGSYIDNLSINNKRIQTLITHGWRVPITNKINKLTTNIGCGVVKVNNNEIESILCTSIDVHKNKHMSELAEIHSLNIALEDIIQSGFKSVNIFFDCDIILNWFLDHSIIWKRNNLLKQINKLGIEISYYKIKGHTNNPYNKLADQIAYVSIYKFGLYKYKLEDYHTFNTIDQLKKWVYLYPPII